MKTLILFLLVITLVLVPGLMPVEAEQNRKKTAAMSKRVYDKITVVSEHIEAKEYESAIVAINEIKAGKLSVYERAQVSYLHGTVEFQLNNLAAALELFKQVVEEPDKISELLNFQTLRTITQLSLSMEKYQDALSYAERLVVVTNRPELDYSLLARVHYKLGKFDKANEAVKTAIAAVREKGKTEPEGLLLLQNAIYYELKDYNKMLEPLGILAKHYPKPTYILYLASVHGQLGNQTEQTSLMESLYENDHLNKSSEILNLVSLYLAEKVPYKGATVLQKALENEEVEATQRNYEMLSQAWLLAAERDNAIDSLGKAAELSESGELFLRQAYLFFDQYNYQETLTSVKNALEKSFEDDEEYGEAYLLKAMAYANLKSYEKGLEACRQAMKYESSEKFAKQWFKYIESEKEKVAQMNI